MSAAVLERRRRVAQIHPERVLSVPDLPFEAELLLADSFSRVRDRKPARMDRSPASDDHHQATEGEWAWRVGTTIVALLIVVGLVVGYMRPGPITGIILPIGLLGWWVLYKLADLQEKQS